MIELDEKDKQIFNILSENAREKLTTIAKRIGLSIDATKKRIKKLEKLGVITKYTIQADPAKYGYPLGTHIYLKLKGIKKEKFNEFVNFLVKKNNVIDVFSMIGDYDIYIVALGKDARYLDEFKSEIKELFGDIITDWKEVIVGRIFKLEEYKI